MEPIELIELIERIERMEPIEPIERVSKPLACLSFDLDNQWSYLKTHGDPNWEKFPSYFEVLIPTAADLLERLNLKVTFFLVGQDAILEKHRDVLKLLAAKGHEIGNHSFHHEPWLHLYTKEEIKREILEAETGICRATGQRPVGFRGPGYSWSRDLIEVLSENHYLYDASTLPTYIGSLARMYYIWTAHLTKQEKKQREGLFGSLKDGLRPVKPYCWQMDSRGSLLEIPVTTIPIVKTPFHLSYLLYLSRFSENLMLAYLKTALTLCRMTGTGLSFLLHPLDLLGGDQVPDLAFFPGMDLAGQRKKEIFEKVIHELAQHFTLVNMRTYATAILGRSNLKEVHLKRLEV